MASIPLPSYLTKKDIKALMETCIRFYAIELLGEGYQGYLVTSWQIPRLGFKWKSSLGFFRDISQITGQDNIKKAYDVLAGWEKEAPDVLSAPIETQEVSETVPRNLNELVEALEKAKSQEEKSALIRSYQAFRAAAPAAPAAPVTEAAAAEGVGIKITPEVLKFFEQSLSKMTSAPFKLVTFFSSPKFLSETPRAKRALASTVSLPKIARRAESLPESERLRLLEFVENLRQAEFSFFAQTKLSRRIFSVQEIIILMGPEVRLGQGEVVALIRGGAPPGKRPSLPGRLFGRIAQRAISKTATKAVTSVLTKAGISITSEAVVGAVGQAAIPIPGLGLVIGLVVGWLIEKGKDLLSLLKRNAPKVAIGLGTFLFGTGFVLQSAVLMGTGGALAAGGFVSQAGGVGPALSSAATGASGVLTGILSLTVASIATPIIVALISIPVIVAIILFIINSGAYIVPPAPFAEAPLFGIPITCSDEKAPVSFSKTTASPIAERAWEITADLYQGFWCFWNRSPDDFPGDTVLYPPSYPELFDESYFARNPNPSKAEISTCGNCMFWCTYLVQKSYRETGNTSLLVTLWSPTMQQDFTRRNKFISSGEATPKNVKPGSVIFFKITPGPNRTNHVAIVHSVNEDGISYVQSNAPSKDSFLSFNESEVGIQSPPGIGVVGIGLP